MSWLYSAALVAEYLGENFSDGEQSAPLNGNPIPQAYLSHDKTISSWSRFPSGMMPGHLTESLGEELLMSYRAAFHVPTSQPLEKERELMGKPLECGEKWHGSFAKLDPNSSLWKTHQCSLLGDLDEFLGTWPQWGSMRDGECWERQTLAHLTKETEFGLSQNTPPPSQKWPTPKTRDWKDGTSQGTMNRQSPDLGKVVGQSKETGSLNPNWVEWLMGWPIGFTDLKPLEMDKSHCVPQQHGEFLAKEIDE
jgi:hypothetical protein